MRIDYIKYAKTVRSEGGDSRLEASAKLDKGENADAAFEDLKNYVHEKLGLKSQASTFKNSPFAEALKETTLA